MPKVSASMISFPVNIAKRRARYLLKLSSPDHPQIVENECFFMTLAKRCAIAVPSVKIVYDRRGSAALLVQRFDRQFDVETKQFFSIHQEDACQFLNRFPEDKYRLSMSEIAEALIRLSATPLVCLRRLLELYAFSYLIGNGDLHAKNISLLVDPLSGQPKLAPAYDLLTTLPYGDRKMALKLDGRDDQFTFQNFSNFGKRYGLPETALKISFKKLASRSLEGMKDAERIGFGARRHQDLSRTFRLRVEKLLEGC
jgi:serine/threonine-protein kinase HipA